MNVSSVPERAVNASVKCEVARAVLFQSLKQNVLGVISDFCELCAIYTLS